MNSTEPRIASARAVVADISTSLGIRALLTAPVRLYLSAERGVLVRFPYLAVLQPLAVGLFYVISWAACATAAYCFPGTVEHPRHPSDVATGLLLMSAVVVGWWSIRQWRERVCLPRPLALPWAWSFATTFLVIVLLASPSYVFEALRYRAIRNLTSYEDTAFAYAITTESSFSKPIDPGAEGKRFLAYAPKEQPLRERWMVNSIWRTCWLLRSDVNGDADAAANIQRLGRYMAPATLERARDVCSKWRAELPVDGFAGPPLDRMRKRRGPCASEVIEGGCGSIYTHAVAHGVRRWLLTSAYGHVSLAPVAVCMALLIAAILSVAGVVRGSAILQAIAVWALIVIAIKVVHPRALTLIYQSEFRTGVARARRWLIPTILVAAMVAAALPSLLLLIRGRRTRWTDTALVAAWLAPILVLLTQEGIDVHFFDASNASARLWIPMIGTGRFDGGEAICIVAASYLLVSALTTVVFARYRRLPGDA